MHADSGEINPYLQQEVLSASPVRLRWMLVKRAEELCEVVRRMWSDGQDAQAGQWIIRVRDILGELLDGVQDNTNPVGRRVADFYVFLLQLLADVEQAHDVEQMATLRDLLSIEAETWRMMADKVASELSGDPSFQAGGIQPPSASAGFVASNSERVVPKAPPLSGQQADLLEGGFSLEV